MKKIYKYSVEQFEQKFSGKRGLSCGINYTDGGRDTMMGASCSQILSYIRTNGKEVSYIACCK